MQATGEGAVGQGAGKTDRVTGGTREVLSVPGDGTDGVGWRDPYRYTISLLVLRRLRRAWGMGAGIFLGG